MTEDGFVSNLKPPSEVLILWKLQRQKGQLESWPFLKVVGERGLFPCGPLLKQRCLAALGANLLRRFSSSGSYRHKKASSRAGLFLKWSAREDSNLRPTGPKPVALPSCATRRILLFFYCGLNRFKRKPCLGKVSGIWSAREDSNLRPTGPKPVALPSCATRRKLRTAKDFVVRREGLEPSRP